jgi:hypothetical protein
MRGELMGHTIGLPRLSICGESPVTSVEVGTDMTRTNQSFQIKRDKKTKREGLPMDKN